MSLDFEGFITHKWRPFLGHPWRPYDRRTDLKNMLGDEMMKVSISLGPSLFASSLMPQSLQGRE